MCAWINMGKNVWLTPIGWTSIKQTWTIIDSWYHLNTTRKKGGGGGVWGKERIVAEPFFFLGTLNKVDKFSALWLGEKKKMGIKARLLQQYK